MAWHDCGWAGLKKKPGPKPQPVKKETKTKEGKQ
jgi:hypothetical protein